MSGAPPSSEIPAPSTESTSEPTNSLLDSQIESDFLSSFSGQVVDSKDNFIRHEDRGSRFSKVTMGAVIAASFALGACASLVRSSRGKMFLGLLSLAVPTSQTVLSRPETVIYSSVFSKSQTFIAPSFDTTNVSLPSKEHGVMDTGTTECCSDHWS